MVFPGDVSSAGPGPRCDPWQRLRRAPRPLPRFAVLRCCVQWGLSGLHKNQHKGSAYFEGGRRPMQRRTRSPMPLPPPPIHLHLHRLCCPLHHPNPHHLMGAPAPAPAPAVGVRPGACRIRWFNTQEEEVLSIRDLRRQTNFGAPPLSPLCMPRLATPGGPAPSWLRQQWPRQLHPPSTPREGGGGGWSVATPSPVLTPSVPHLRCAHPAWPPPVAQHLFPTILTDTPATRGRLSHSEAAYGSAAPSPHPHSRPGMPPIWNPGWSRARGQQRLDLGPAGAPSGAPGVRTSSPARR